MRRITAIGLTDPGCERESNEDRILADLEHLVFVVADGMGGQRCGEKAAELATTTIQHYVETTFNRKEVTWPFGYDPQKGFKENQMATAIRLANRRIWREAESIPQYTGMGSTIAAVFISEDRVTVGSVGDSRIYLYRSNALSLLTKDDSVIAGLVESGAVTPEVAEQHPMRHVLTEAAGAREEIRVHLSEFLLADGDRLLLSTDGLHGVISDDGIRAVMNGTDGLRETTEKLIAATREKGAPDNVSCVLIEYRDDGAAQEAV